VLRTDPTFLTLSKSATKPGANNYYKTQLG